MYREKIWHWRDTSASYKKDFVSCDTDTNNSLKLTEVFSQYPISFKAIPHLIPILPSSLEPPSLRKKFGSP